MAKIEVIVTDMGNGGAYCSNCGCDLDGGNPLVEIPPVCPQCKEEFTDRDMFVSPGGSDF
jgi:predicted Zn-ribbon and HTH transcriptional regulator